MYKCTAIGLVPQGANNSSLYQTYKKLQDKFLNTDLLSETGYTMEYSHFIDNTVPAKINCEHRL